MISRLLHTRILKLLDHFPAVAILGPRQIGKTTLAKSLITAFVRKVIYLDLELPSDIAKLTNAQIFFETNKEACIIIDEIQRRPDLFPVMRSMIDRDRNPGRFIILGSASPELLKQSSESLAGRIAYTELTGLLIPEIEGVSPVNNLWVNGQFPEPFILDDPELRRLWYHSFILTYIERDIPLLGLSVDPLLLNRMLQMVAHNHAMLLNHANFARSLAISSPTVSKYIGFFERVFLFRLLHPWHANLKKRLVKSPKIYLRDSGMLHHLLGIDVLNQLFGHPMLGNSWEGFVIEQVINALPVGILPFFFRTAEGAECDLVLSRGADVVACIEIKFADAPRTTKGFTTAIADLKCKNNFIIIPNCDESYLLNDHISVCDPARFILDFLPRIWG
ncbi:MAG: ATP-binding protein [Bacteroidales bacterium]|nr:ATP-binding protein [Bacteroidales bacterium]